LALRATASDPFAGLDRKQRILAEKYLKMAEDDDWLTGIWLYDSDESMKLYTLFEKTADGYRVSNYYPRYPVTWWTGKVEKSADRIKIWNYRIVGEKFVLPDAPTDIMYFKNGILILREDRYYKTMRPVKDKTEIARLAKWSFISGEKYLKEQITKTNASGMSPQP
jgi:hypothetical protein